MASCQITEHASLVSLRPGEAPCVKHPAGGLVVVRREREADRGNRLPLPSEVILQFGIDAGVEAVDLRAAEVVPTNVLGTAKQRSAGKFRHAASLAHLKTKH